MKGIILGVAIFFLIGSILPGLMGAGNENNAVTIAFWIAVVLGVAGMIHEAKINMLTDNPAPQTYSMNLPMAYGTVKNAITAYHRGPYWWSIRQDDPQSGLLTAVLKYKGKRLLPKLSELGSTKQTPDEEERQLILTARFAPVGDKTEIRLTWEVVADFVRLDSDAIISDVTACLNAALGG